MNTPKVVFLRIEYTDIDPQQALAPGTPVTLDEMREAFGGDDMDATIVNPFFGEAEVSELTLLRADLAAAAGECLVPLPEPGSDMAKVVTANRLMRAEITRLTSKANKPKRPPKKRAPAPPCVVDLSLARVLTQDEVDACAWVEVVLRALVAAENRWLHLFFDPKGACVRYRWSIDIDESVLHATLRDALIALGCAHPPDQAASTVEGIARAVEGCSYMKDDYTVISFGPPGYSPTVSVSKDSWERDSCGASLALALTQAFRDMLGGGPDWTEGYHS